MDDEVSENIIPKLIIQPLVENDIIHGIEPSSTPCTLTISARQLVEDNEKYLELRIEDDGVGFNTERLRESKSIGITNVRDRLKLLYQNSLFSIFSIEGQGTTVTIKVPEREVKK